jgi:broad specificity phosphatase PhoE
MKIIFIRHGESEGNIAGVINDDPTQIVNLTERGIEQAEAASNKLRTVRFSHCYASEFPRAQQTAEILLRHHSCPLLIDARLNERRTGLNGQPVQVFNDTVRQDRLRIKPKGGESFLEEMERLRSFLDEIAMRHPDGIVLAVSHENPIRAAQALTFHDIDQINCYDGLANCETVEFEWPCR